VPVDERRVTERIRDRVVELTRSRRFTEQGGIGALASALRRGDGADALACLERGDSVALTEVPTLALLDRTLGPAVVEGYAEAFRASDPAAKLRAFSRFRVLCAHRRGPLGVWGLNQLIERLLFEAGLLSLRGEHYSGRPILIEQNDYRAGLFNGDIGMLLSEPSTGGALRAYFDAGGGQLRVLSTTLLPRHQTAFAMSVHKSQGSEFDHVMVVLPDPSSPLLTRELLYTAVSRARQRVSLYGSADSVLIGAARRVERTSGLADAAAGQGSLLLGG
jgi:exodeoxyribonuclease V alpha subunit